MDYHLIAILLFLFSSPSLPTTLPHPHHYDVAVNKKGKRVVKHRIYITIDDHPTTTSMAMLSLLKRCGVKATFFIVGISEWYYRKNPKYKPLLRRHKSLLAIHRAGHTLGNHTVTHRNLCKLKRSEIRWELRTTQQLIKKATGVTPKYWRPPFLAHCRVARQEAAKLGLRFVGAHVDDLHGSARNMWYRVRRRALRQSKKSTIILFHKNVKKLKAFLELAGLCPLPSPICPRSH